MGNRDHAVFDDSRRVAEAVNQGIASDPLLRNEEWLRLATEGSQLGLWYWNEVTKELFWDAKTREMFGVPEAGAVTLETFYKALHPGDLERVTETWRYALEKGLPCQIEYRSLRPDGSSRWIHARGSGYYDKAGNPVCMVGVVFDTTERKAAEQECMELSGRLINAQERERTRLAREIHDDFSQRIALLAVGLDSLAKSANEFGLGVQFSKLRKAVDDIGTDLHSLSHRLHSHKIDHLGLVPSLSSCCQELSQQYGIQIDFSHEAVPESVPPDVALSLFRIVQEALHNVSKYSRASSVEVRLKGDLAGISLVLSDNGVGCELSAVLAADGIGIRSMRERTRMLGGTFNFQSRPLQGTQIAVTIPLKSVAPAA